MTDPEFRNDTRIGEQPALRTSNGRSWLIIGALTMVASGGLLVALSSRQSATGFLGAGVVAAIYVVMIVAAIVIRNVRARLVTLAVILIVMSFTALGFVLAILAAEWSAMG